VAGSTDTKIQGEIVKQYLAKHPDLPNKTVARLLCKDEPQVFGSIESARDLVRYYRGRHGATQVRQLRDCRFLLPPPTPDNPYSLPDSDSKPFTPYYVPDSVERVFFMGDIHIPFHDKAALTTAIKAAKDFAPEYLLLVGDVADCYKLSKFCQDPRARDFNSEKELVRSFLYSLRKQFPDTKIVYKEGNHERRFETYLKTKAAELFGTEEFHLSVLYGLHELDIEWVGEKRPIYSGQLTVLHGDEFWRSFTNPVNPARGAFLKTKDICIVFHLHQTSEHTEPRLRGEMITTWSGGCLCDLHPEYSPFNKWNHGYALQVKEPNGDFHLENPRIWKGKAL